MDCAEAVRESRCAVRDAIEAEKGEGVGLGEGEGEGEGEGQSSWLASLSTASILSLVRIGAGSSENRIFSAKSLERSATKRLSSCSRVGRTRFRTQLCRGIEV